MDRICPGSAISSEGFVDLIPGRPCDFGSCEHLLMFEDMDPA